MGNHSPNFWKAFSITGGALTLCLIMACSGSGAGGSGNTTGGANPPGGANSVPITLYGTTPPAFIAVQDGNGPWQPLVITGNSGSISVTSADGRYGVAFGQINNATGTPSFNVFVWQTTLQESQQVIFDTGGLPASAPRVSGSVVGFQSGEVLASVSAKGGGTYVSPSSSSPAFTFQTSQGTQDIAVVSLDSQMQAKRIALRRNLAISGDTSLPPIDLNAESLPPSYITINAEGDYGSTSLVIPNGPWLQLGVAPVTGGAFLGTVLASSQRSPQDLYFLETGRSDGRFALLFTDLSVPSSLSLGSLLGDVVVGFATGSSSLQAQWPGLNGATGYDLEASQTLSTSSVSWSMTLSQGWAGSSANLIYLQPNLSAVFGSEARWQFARGPALYWTLYGHQSYSANNMHTISNRYLGGAKAGDFDRGSSKSGAL